MPRTAFFHEDEYCQVELLPVAAGAWCRAEMGRVAEFADAHRAGVGYTDMYLRDGAPVALQTLGLSVSEVRPRVEQHLPPLDQVLTGYGSRTEVCSATVGWGTGTGQALFADAGDDGIVRALWLSLWTVPPGDRQRWVQALGALGDSAGLLLADWNSLELVSLSDPAALTTYFDGYGGRASET